MVTWVGIIMVARYSPSKKPEPLNCILVKAKAAMEALTRVSRV